MSDKKIFTVSEDKKKVKNEKPFKHKNIWNFISIIIFFISIILFLVSYFYKGYVVKQKEDLGREILALSQEINTEEIERLIGLNNKLNLAQEVVENHIILSPIIKFLEEETVSSIKYETISFKNEVNIIDISASGFSEDLKSLAQQSDEFANREEILEHSFSNLSRGGENYNFSLNIKFKKDSLYYINN